MDLLEKTAEFNVFKFSKLGELNLGVQFIAQRPAFVAVASTKATASAQYTFLDGASVNSAGQVVLLPDLEAGAPEALVGVTKAWAAFALEKGYGVAVVPKTNYPIVAKHYKYSFSFTAGSSVLGSMASFTNNLLGTFVHDVHMESPAKRAFHLMKGVDDLLLDTLKGTQMTQPLPLPLFKTRCNALANRAALFQQLAITVTPPTMSTYTLNDLVLTSNLWAQRSRLTEVLSSDIVVSQELAESIVHVGSEFDKLEPAVKRALLNAYVAQDVEALAAVLSTITLAPVQDAGDVVTFGNIDRDATTSLVVDGVAQPLEDVPELGTLLFQTKSVLLSNQFLELVISHFSSAAEITFHHQGLEFDLLTLHHFLNPSVAPHMADIEVGMYGLNEDEGTLVSVDGSSRWEQMDTLSDGISAVAAEAFIGSPDVIAALEASKEEIISEINTSSITLTSSDLNSLGVASINYSNTKPVAWMALVATCEALYTDVYNSASNATVVAGVEFMDSDRPKLFDSPMYVDTHLVSHTLSTAEQMKRRMRLGDSFQTSAMSGQQDILRSVGFKLNGVEMHDTGLQNYNPHSVAHNYNSHTLDQANSATFEIQGVYLITFMSEPFGTSHDHYDHNCFSNFLNTVRIESVELVLKFNPKFFARFPNVAVQVDVFVMNPNIKRQMSGLMGNLLAPDP